MLQGRNWTAGVNVKLEDFGTGVVHWAPGNTMSFARISLSVAGIVGVVAAALAAATIWLLLAQPVTVADAVAQGEVSPIVKALAGVLYDALQGVLRYL